MIAAIRAAHLEATRALVERTIGRPLRQAEQVVDVFMLTRALDDAKDQLHAAIDRERDRAVREAIRTGHPLRLQLTRGMLRPLESLFRLGVREAFEELSRAGCNPRRALAEQAPEPKYPHLQGIAAGLESLLNGFSVRLQMLADEKRVQLLLSGHGDSISGALAKALLNQPGGRSIAAGLVSTAMFTGMGVTFEENADLVATWEYSAVLDGGTCDACAPLDGTTYTSLDELFAVLPGFGPNPECLGGGRCRCRAVPA